MGSMTSRPKIKTPRAPQVVYMPAPAPAYAPPAASQNPSSSGGSSSSPEPEQTAAAARANNLLLRSRGSFSTVLTSFRGLLSPMNGAGQRKTLLGE